MSIPLITHQIWIQGWDVIPDKFKLNTESLKKHNPEFTHMTWDEKSLREECAKISHNVRDKFDSLKLFDVNLILPNERNGIRVGDLVYDFGIFETK
jgi:mannosyltransferase OCH1-like enzyme